MSDMAAAAPKLIVYDKTIAYADGSEKTLLSIMSDPRFSEDTAWQGVRDWALYYHLSPLRRNLLNWIDYGDKPLRILELGAGCGAITAFFVTIPGARVTAVEGSLDRARVIQARCGKSANLEIHVCNLSEFKPQKELFDIVSLIGVLEYAGKYEPGNDPFATVLSRLAPMLRDDGCLLLAIENRLGHKYIAGCPEDHYNRPFEGINGYPHYNGVRTFTKRGLSEKLSLAGFPAQAWYYPYPDYKLPSVVYSDSALKRSDFDWLALTDVEPEQNAHSQPAFDEFAFLENARQSVGDAGIGIFMNSFLVVASKTNPGFLDKNNGSILAYTASVKSRAPQFRRYTFFVNQADDSIAVVRKHAGTDTQTDTGDIWYCAPLPVEPYHAHYRNLFIEIRTAISRSDYGQAEALLRLWIELLMESSSAATPGDRDRFDKFCLLHFDRTLYKQDRHDRWIDGNYLDFVPPNILVSLTGDKPAATNQAWRLGFRIPSQLVFDRGLRLVALKTRSECFPENVPVNEQTLLPALLHARLSGQPLYRHQDVLSHTVFETWLQSGINKGYFSRTVNQDQKFAPFLQEQEFFEKTVTLVEAGRSAEAIDYYTKHRAMFTASADALRFDGFMEKVRAKLR